jgi:hypothetical protein
MGKQSVTASKTMGSDRQTRPVHTTSSWLPSLHSEPNPMGRKQDLPLLTLAIWSGPYLGVQMPDVHGKWEHTCVQDLGHVCVYSKPFSSNRAVCSHPKLCLQYCQREMHLPTGTATSIGGACRRTFEGGTDLRESFGRMVLCCNPKPSTPSQNIFKCQSQSLQHRILLHELQPRRQNGPPRTQSQDPTPKQRHRQDARKIGTAACKGYLQKAPTHAQQSQRMLSATTTTTTLPPDVRVPSMGWFL